MKDYGVDTSMVVVDHNAFTGRAIIQVSQASHDNTIVLNPGANHQITAQDIDKVLSQFKSGDFVILQNELNSDATLYLLKSCSAKGMVVCLNPAPCPKNLASVLPLELVDILILNESESESLVCQLSTSNVNQKKCNDPATICEIVLASYPGLSVMVITLGERGLVAGARLHNGAAPTIQSVPITRSVKVQDTTGAGDTFVGFMCGHLISNISLSSDQTHSKTDILTAISAQPSLLEMSLQTGILASGVCCEHSGAMIAIPTKSELMKL
ncbi:putative ribokinase, variant 2 [Batrachochytrium dendrobatidis]